MDIAQEGRQKIPENESSVKFKRNPGMLPIDPLSDKVHRGSIGWGIENHRSDVVWRKAHRFIRSTNI